VTTVRPARSRRPNPPRRVATRDLDSLPLPERLIKVSTRLFARYGYEATSVQQIVDAAGVTKGALYHHFAAKDDLLVEIYRRVLEWQTARLEEIAAGPGPADERLRAVVADVILTSVDRMDELIVFFRSQHLLPADRQQRVRGQRRRYHDRVCELIREGQRAGVFTAAVPADVAVHFCFGAINQLGTWFHAEGELTAAQVAECFDRLFLDGLRS
jgi:AcrR family transcriptional regulator